MSLRLRDNISSDHVPSRWLVARVWEGSAAELAGLRTGDIALKIDDKRAEKVVNNGQIPESAKTILVLRGDEEESLSLLTGRRAALP